MNKSISESRQQALNPLYLAALPLAVAAIAVTIKRRSNMSHARTQMLMQGHASFYQAAGMPYGVSLNTAGSQNLAYNAGSMSGLLQSGSGISQGSSLGLSESARLQQQYVSRSGKKQKYDPKLQIAFFAFGYFLSFLGESAQN